MAAVSHRGRASVIWQYCSVAAAIATGFVLVGVYKSYFSLTSADGSDFRAAARLLAAARPAAQLPLQAAVGSATSGSAQAAVGDGTQPQQLQFLRPKNYTLPQECIKHEVLYPAVLDMLRPWFVRGIRKEDLDACSPVAPKDYDISKGTPGEGKFRMLLWNNEVWVTSGGLRRQMFQMLDYGMVMQIQAVAKKWGLPNMEFAVGWRDLVGIKDEGDRRCPLFTYCKSPEAYEILIPDGHFVQYAYDKWVEKMKDGGDVPWEQKEQKVVGSWTPYCANVPQPDRWGNAEKCIRGAYMNHTWGPSNVTWFRKAGGLSEQSRFKYTFSPDGVGCSTRFQKLLATGQTVIKQDSSLSEFFYPALRPWVHYVPTGYNGLEEVERIVQFLIDNDDMARAIGQNAQRFAREHLSEEGRHCYIKVLMEEMAQLMTYTPKLEDFPARITFEEDMNKYAKDKLNPIKVE